MFVFFSAEIPGQVPAISYYRDDAAAIGPAASRWCMKTAILTISALTLASLAGCSSAYYGTMEKLGYHKRDILVSRVGEARDSQQQAKEQFKSALQRFNELLGTSGGTLQVKYDKLSADYEKCDAKAQAVRKRITDVEDVGAALFKEWKKELAQYTNQDYRTRDQKLFDDTHARYDQLITAMKRAEGKMDPVLAAFHDRVLFLKHNLNAQAVASLQGELGSVETNVDSLVKDMEDSIREAESFINELSTKP
jgi:hypothetical protein